MIETLPLPELNRRAFDVLFEKLGPVQAIRFLRQYSSGHDDYQAIKDRIFEGRSVDDIFDEAERLESEASSQASN